jgi:cell migration-inducing and hyaluronan-binding protein
MDKGSWVMFELPGFTTAASGKEEASLDALRKSSETAYFKDKNALWVKLVSPSDWAGPLVTQASLAVSRGPEPQKVAGGASIAQ